MDKIHKAKSLKLRKRWFGICTFTLFFFLFFQKFVQEVEIMKTLYHPNLVKLIGTCINEPQMMIIMVRKHLINSNTVYNVYIWIFRNFVGMEI